MSGLDRETRDVHTVFVTVTDGQWVDVAEVVITVTDVNDNHPIFVDKNFTIAISEHVQRDFYIVQVRATDIDLGNNATVRYGWNFPFLYCSLNLCCRSYLFAFLNVEVYPKVEKPEI